MWLHLGVVEHEKRALDQTKQQAIEELAAWRRSLSPAADPDKLTAVYPRHPKRIGGIYYRGNDERSEELYNGGDYCTCKFRLELRGSDGRTLQAGDAVPGGTLSLRLEIERTPFAAEALFSRHVIQSTFLSRTPPKQRHDDLSQEVRRFTPLVKGQQWEAVYPLGTVSPQGAVSPQDTVSPQDKVAASSGVQQFSGRVFLYNGGYNSEVITAGPQYSLDYTLRIVDGRLSSDSDLRMGAIYFTRAIFLTPADKVPVDEWFSARPLPEIVGGNTTNAALLGIKPHEERLGVTLGNDSPADE